MTPKAEALLALVVPWACDDGCSLDGHTVHCIRRCGQVRRVLAEIEQEARAEAEAKVAVWKAHHAQQVMAKQRTAAHNRRLADEKKAAEAEAARLRALAAGWVAYLHGYASTNTDPSVPYPHRGDWTECPWHPCRQAAAILAPATTPAPPAPECICAVASENNPHPNIDCPLREEENHA